MPGIFLPVMTPTTMGHSVSLRRLNYLYGWAENYLHEDGKVAEMLRDELTSFQTQAQMTGYIDKRLINNGKNRGFSLETLSGFGDMKKTFGETYTTYYKASLGSLAQLHRHRTIDYTMAFLSEPEFFIPPIIYECGLVDEWLEDMYSIADTIPQGLIVQIREKGNKEAFIEKCYERLCNAAQYETEISVYNVLVDYCDGTDDPTLKKLLSGARCTFGYECKEPCKRNDGIKKILERQY